MLHYFLVVILYWLQAVQYCTAYTCNIAHISYVHILSAYVVCIFYLLFGVLATLAFFPYSICKLFFFIFYLLVCLSTQFQLSTSLILSGWKESVINSNQNFLPVLSFFHYTISLNFRSSLPWLENPPEIQVTVR